MKSNSFATIERNNDLYLEELIFNFVIRGSDNFIGPRRFNKTNLTPLIFVFYLKINKDANIHKLLSSLKLQNRFSLIKYIFKKNLDFFLK